jgi:hypothetical protein
MAEEYPASISSKISDRPGTYMRIGIDFDNTLVCCAPLFHRVASEQGLVPPHLPPTKDAVRQSLKDRGQETIWTELQGTIYGPRLSEALPFVGAKEFITLCHRKNIPMYVISHKTRHAVRGPSHDLHEASHRWLERVGFYNGSGLSREEVFFEPTRADKMNRIRTLGCTHFIDDLDEVFDEPHFPAGVKQWLFSPDSHPKIKAGRRSFTTWSQIQQALVEELPHDAG